MKTFVIQLDSHDDPTSVRDKMAWSKAPRILLVWPRRGAVLRRPVDLAIVQRFAQSLGAQVAIVTHDGAVQEHAAEVGIPVFGSTAAAQRGSWRKPRSARKLNWRAFRERSRPEDLRVRQVILRRQASEPAWLRWLAFVVGLLAVLALASFFLPAARIELVPQRETQQLTLELWASPDIQEVTPSGRIPASLLSVVVEGSAQQASSGSVGIPDGQASGEVLFSNLGEVPLDLPAGTVVVSAPANGEALRFATTRTVRLPGGVGQTVNAPAMAVLPGSQGNVAAGAIQAVEGSLGLSALASNPQPFQGGSERLSPAPQPADYLTAQRELQTSLQASALEELTRQLGEGEWLVPGSLQVGQVLSDTREPAVGEPGDFARLNQQVEFRAYRVREADLVAVAQPALTASRPDGTQAVGTLQLDFLGDAEFSDGTAHWRMDASQTVEASWSANQAAQAVVGRSPGEASQVLGQMFALAQPAQVTILPSWWMRLPFLALRIQVVRP